jgi:tetratricopeptide (TPR) repeat protein
MSEKDATPKGQETPAEEDDFWADVLGAAVLSGVALWGVSKITKLFETPENTAQPNFLDQAWKSYAAGDTTKGRENLSKWINANRDKPLELNDLSWHMSTNRIDPESAVAVAEYVVKLAPQTATYWDTLAEAYFVCGRQEDARKACDEAWKHTPNPQTQFMLHLRMGMIYEMQPLIHLAIKQYQKAQALNASAPPYDIANVYFGLGRCHAANEDWARSIQAFEQSLELRPGNPVIRAFLANGLIGVDPPRLQEAQSHLQSALNEKPEWDLPYYLMACAKAKVGDCGSAAQWCEKGIKYFSSELVEWAKTEPIFERCRRQILEVLVGSGLMSKQEYNNAVSPTKNLPRLSPGTERDLRLSAQLEKAKPRALPYFISFFAEEGKELAEELRGRLGDEGFLSTRDVQTGSQWKKTLANHLKRAKTFLMLETSAYHNRSSCKIERAFAFAAGMRVIRVVLCPYRELPEYPSYVDDLQYEDFAGQELSSVVEKILDIDLPGPVDDLNTRKYAGVELVRSLTPNQLRDLAYQLNFGEELQEDGGQNQIRKFIALAFRDASNADQFCEELDLTSLFK